MGAAARTVDPLGHSVAERFAFVFFRGMSLLALRAKAAHQALCNDGDDITGEYRRTDAHVDQAREDTEYRVRMQGGQDQVTGHGGAQGHLRSFPITHFAHQNDIRVLAQDGAHTTGEVDLG